MEKIAQKSLLKRPVWVKYPHFQLESDVHNQKRMYEGWFNSTYSYFFRCLKKRHTQIAITTHPFGRN